MLPHVTGENETQPESVVWSLDVVLAARLRVLRSTRGWSLEAVAAAMTALGVPTRPATVRRLESGAQPMTAEQLLMLTGLLAPGEGLTGLVGMQPFRIGAIAFRDEAAIEQLLTGAHPTEERTAVDRMGQIMEGADRVWLTHQLADLAHCAPADVDRACLHLWGDPNPQPEVARRRTAQRDRATAAGKTPQPATPAWRAHQTWAIRQVAQAITEHLQQEGNS